MQERIRTLERKLETELETRDQLIKKLTHQVDTQSSQIATLTFQLHHSNKATTATTSTKKSTANDMSGATTASSSNASSKEFFNFSNVLNSDASNNGNICVDYFALRLTNKNVYLLRLD